MIQALYLSSISSDASLILLSLTKILLLNAVLVVNSAYFKALTWQFQNDDALWNYQIFCLLNMPK